MKLPSRKESSGEFVVPDPGVYLMTLVGYGDPEASKFDPDKLRIKLKFRICDGEEFDGVDVHQWYGFTMHEKSLLYPVMKALNGGADIDPEEEVDLDDFVGKKMMGVVEAVEKDDKTYAKIKAASPVKRKKPTAVPGGNKDLAAAKRARARDLADDDDDPALWETDDAA